MNKLNIIHTLKQLNSHVQDDFRYANLRRVIEPFISGSVLLDVGCGTGHISILASAKVGEVYAIDIEREAVMMTKEKAQRRRGGNVSVIVTDATYSGFRDEMFDCVVCVDLLEHLENDVTCLKEVYRILRERRRAIIVVPCLMFLYGKYDEIAGHHRRYERKQLVSLIQTMGFRVIKVRFWNFVGLLPALLFSSFSKFHDFIFIKHSDCTFSNNNNIFFRIK